MSKTSIQTFRLSTHKLHFGSPIWRRVRETLSAEGIYWFLTDPIDTELIAVKVFKSHKYDFLRIVNGIKFGYCAEFRITTLPDKVFL